MINGVRDNVLIGEKFDGDRFAGHVELPIDEANLDQLRVYHYYGHYEVLSTGIWQFIRHRTIFIPYVSIALKRLWNGVCQIAFNSRKLITKERMTYLRMAQQLTLTRGKFTLQELMVEMHGERWFWHPGHDEHREHMKRLLELLVDSGDLNKSDLIVYKLSGKALESIAVYEEEERRYKVAGRWQFIVVTLGLATIFFTAAQTGFVKLPTLFDWSKSKSSSQECKD